MAGFADNHYARLGVSRSASAEEIRAAYHELARKLHPDTNAEPSATEEFIQVQEAYELLSDPEKRGQYDLTLPPEDDPGIKVDTLYSRNTLVSTNNPQLLYVMMIFEQSDEIAEQEAPPLNLCIVVDRSTSMKGVRMDVLKSTANKLIAKLRPVDYLSIVAFSDRAEVVLPATREIDPIRASARMSLLQASGGTELYHGLDLGVTEVLRNANTSYINHVILITDGHTYGDEEKCLALAKQASKQGITISGLGIGSDWKDDFMDELTGITGGNSMYVSKAKDIQRFLELKFSELNHTYAKKVGLTFEKNPDIELRYAFRMQPEPSKLELVENTISLGDIPRNKPFTLVFELLLKAFPKSGSMEILKGTLEMDIPTKMIPKTTLNIRWSLPIVREAQTEPPPQKIVQAMSRLTLYRMQEQARQDIDAGDYDAATRRLKHLATQLLSNGESGLATTVLSEAGRIENGQAPNTEGGKQIKYGTRALLLPTGLEERTR